MPQDPRQVAYEVAMQRLDSQLSRVDAVDNKVGTVLGLAATITGIFAGFAAVVVDPEKSASVAAAGLLGLVVLVVVLATVREGLAALKLEMWDERPNWDELLRSAEELDVGSMHAWVAEGCVLSLKDNEPKVVKKAHRATNARRLALIEAGLVGASLISLLVVNAAAS